MCAFLPKCVIIPLNLRCITVLKLYRVDESMQTERTSAYVPARPSPQIPAVKPKPVLTLQNSRRSRYVAH